MKQLLKLEEFAVFAISVFAIVKLNAAISWWLYLLFFFSPDLGMLGYLVNPKTGAVSYNFFHHKALACILIFTGFCFNIDFVSALGFIFLAHSSFDRMMGYGLKYSDDFKHTNIGYL